MKKYLIIWFVLLFVLRCSTEKNKIDPLTYSYKVNPVILDKSIIEDDLNYFLKKYKRNWSVYTKAKFINIVYCGSKEFNINHKVVMSIIAIESQYRINVIGKNDHSKDFGLAQINSKYLKRRYKATEPYLTQYHIKYTDSKFDMSKNLFSAFMYLKDIDDYSDLVQFSDYISAYNQGVRGCRRNNNNAYYEKFLKEYMSI